MFASCIRTPDLRSFLRDIPLIALEASLSSPSGVTPHTCPPGLCAPIPVLGISASAGWQPRKPTHPTLHGPKNLTWGGSAPPPPRIRIIAQESPPPADASPAWSSETHSTRSIEKKEQRIQTKDQKWQVPNATNCCISVLAYQGDFRIITSQVTRPSGDGSFCTVSIFQRTFNTRFLAKLSFHTAKGTSFLSSDEVLLSELGEKRKRRTPSAC